MGAKVDAEKKSDHMARVSVTDFVWADFKQAAGRRRVSVTAYLGTLIEREVTRLRAVAAREESLSATEATAALAEVKSLTGDLASIANRLERAAKWGRSDEELAAMKAEEQSRWSGIPATPAPASVARTAEGVPLSGDWTAYRRDGGVNPADIPDWEE